MPRAARPRRSSAISGMSRRSADHRDVHRLGTGRASHGHHRLHTEPRRLRSDCSSGAHVQRLGHRSDRPEPGAGAAVSERCEPTDVAVPAPVRRVDRDRGSAVVATLTLSFVVMAGAVIWLSRTVDRSLHDRSQATAVAFQAARAGAQQIDLEASRRSGSLALDPDRAIGAARAAVATGLAANGDRGSVGSIIVDRPQITVTVVITTSGRTVSGTATATAHFGFDAPDQ